MKRSLLFTALIVLLCAGILPAHPGRLDKYGGHYEIRKDRNGKVIRRYHFHRGSLQGKSFRNRKEALKARREYERKQRQRTKAPGPQESRTVEMKVVKVYKPDVIKLSNGRLAKLVGVKCPADTGKKIRATEKLRGLIEGRKILFEFANPPTKGIYFRGFVWIEQTDKNNKTRKSMVNILILRDGDCEAVLSETGKHRAEFTKSLGLEFRRPGAKVTKVYKATSCYIKGVRLVHLAGLKPVLSPKIKKEALEFVRNKILNKNVRYEKCKPGHDSTGAALLFIWLGKEKKDMLNIMLIEKGYAVPDPRFYHTYSKDFDEAYDRYKKRIEKESKLREKGKEKIKAAKKAEKTTDDSDDDDILR